MKLLRRFFFWWHIWGVWTIARWWERVQSHLWPLQRCPYCHRWFQMGEIRRRRLNTAYEDDTSNWMRSCNDCHEGALECYEEQWKEYYGSRGC